ncbi:unnamed protein product, partial [Ectocarpus sp. 8 AP-2014]
MHTGRQAPPSQQFSPHTNGLGGNEQLALFRLRLSRPSPLPRSPLCSALREEWRPTRGCVLRSRGTGAISTPLRKCRVEETKLSSGLSTSSKALAEPSWRSRK